MIPKRIFYIWFGDKMPWSSELCVQTWRQIMPDYEIVKIDEKATKWFDLKKELAENKWFRVVYERKMWAYVSDYIRLKVLYYHGGIYQDTDVSAVRSFDNMLELPGFCALEDCPSLDKKYPAPAIIGCKKNNPFLREAIKFYDKQIWEKPIYTIPMVFDDVLLGHGISKFSGRNWLQPIKTKDMVFFPERYFLPHPYGASFNPECIGPDTHTIHWWAASWNNPDTLFFLENKHKMSIYEIDRHLAQNKKKIYLFGIKQLPIGYIETKGYMTAVFLLWLPLILIHRQPHKTKIKLFGIVPILKIK